MVHWPIRQSRSMELGPISLSRSTAVCPRRMVPGSRVTPGATEHRGSIIVLHAGKGPLHGGQLVIVGGKQGLGPQALGVGAVFQHRPGDAHAVEGGGAPADLGQDQQAVGGGGMALCI